VRNIGTTHHAPLRAIPVFRQRLLVALKEERVAHCPDVVGTDCRDTIQRTVDITRTRTGYDAPLNAIPVLDQSKAAVLIVSNCPDIIRRDSGHSSQNVVDIGYIGTGNDTPLRAIPVFNQCATWLLGGTIRTDCPYIVRGNGGYAIEYVSCAAGMSTGDNFPAIAVPMFCQCMENTRISVITNGPYIVG